MRSVLIQFDYVYNDQDSIWVRPGYAGIAYSDGDEVEQRIASIINNASDLSILSDDLRQHCTDWPSLYHLSGTRANILRPFEPDLRGDILEIGAGCGAITRYLGECGGNVLALEGSPRRAAIARARTRDLKNVVVVCDKFDQFQCDKRFDVVTLIGVLEYANLFSAAENPTLAMLKRARSFLKPNGKLIIAIENKLGLKYFAGAPEDHVGIPMYGIEGRYRNDQPNTFGGRELSDLIEKAGFSTVKFLAPFPDYKLPVSIVTERGFSSDAFDSAALAWQSVRQDRQLPPIMAFSPELVWPSITNNGLALDLANSFLIVASPDERGNLVPSGTLAWHFTTDRRKVFCKNAEFVQVEANQVEVRYNRLDPAAPNPVVGSILQHYIPERAEYRHGRVLSYELMRVVMRDGWRNEEVCTLLRDWLNFIATLAAAQGKLIDLSAQLPGSFFDCIPQNIITSDDGGFHVIDTEWATKEKLEVGYIVFRALWALIYSVTRFGRSAENVSTTYLGFVLSVMNGLGWSISDEAIATYVTLESEIQAEVSGRVIDLQDVMNWLKNAVMPMSNLNQAVTERDGQVASLNQAVAERDGQIAELVHTVNAIRQSNSWRVTSPLRLFSHILKWRGGYFKSKARRSLQNFAKALYWKIPVQYREPVLFWLYRNVPSLFMGVGHFENWRRTNLGKSAAINGESHLLVIDDMPVTISLSGRIAIHLHMFYEDLASEFRGFLENMPFSYDLFVSVTTARGKALCHEKFESLPKLNHLHVEIVDNRGRDIAPFFCAFGSMLKDYNYIAHLHSKKSLYNKGVTDGWRQYLLEGLLGNEVRIRRIFGVMQTSTYGIVYPQNFYMLPYFANTWLANRSMGAKWCARLGISPIPNGYFDFPAGTMFWARTDALKPLFEAGITLGDFAEELGQTDGTFAHCLERLLVLTCLRQGFSPAILKDMKTPSSSPWRVEQCLTRSMDYTRDRLRAPHIKLIGFDIFDTLLCRPLLDAESVKEIVARRIGGEAGRLYLKYRPLAESNARNEYNRDIGLTPIYAKLAELTGLPHATLNLLRECEEYVERESLGPRSGGLELYREALTSGKPVVLISDTFLSLDHIEFSLRRHGVEGWRRLFVSSEIGLRKDTGALYDFIFSEFEISPSQFLMVGDNECSDVQIPVDKGAEFLSVMRPIEIGRSISNLRPIIKDIEFNGSLDEQLTLGLVIREEFSSTRYLDIEPGPVVVQTPFNTGYSIVGPLLVSFADWLLAMSRTEGTERLYFLAREGDLLKSVFDLWAQKASGSPSSHYLVVSRRAVSVPALKNLEDIYSVAQATYFSNTLESFLMERYGVDLASERWAIVAEKTRWNRSQIVEVKQGKIDHLRELLDLIQDDICQVAKSELEPLQLYFHKEGLYSSGRQAVVDVGYGATIQNYLNQIVSLPIHGYYLMTDRRSAAVRERHGVSVLGCMLDNVPCTAEAPLMYRYSFELEKLLSSSNAQVVKYLKDAEGEVQPVFRNLSDAEEKGNAFRVELQAGVLSYVKDAVHVRESLFPDFRPSTGVARQICEIFLQKHSCSEVPLLKGVALDDHYCGRGVVY